MIQLFYLLLFVHPFLGSLRCSAESTPRNTVRWFCERLRLSTATELDDQNATTKTDQNEAFPQQNRHHIISFQIISYHVMAYHITCSKEKQSFDLFVLRTYYEMNNFLGVSLMFPNTLAGSTETRPAGRLGPSTGNLSDGYEVNQSLVRWTRRVTYFWPFIEVFSSSKFQGVFDFFTKTHPKLISCC